MLIFDNFYMKYFLVFCLVFTTKIFATSTGESWEYGIRNERFHGERITATRIAADGSRKDFYVIEGNHWTYEDFFESPKAPCDRHLVGQFVLNAALLKKFRSNSVDSEKITDHKLHLRIRWFYDDSGQLVRGDLENLGYYTSSPVTIDEFRS